MSNILRGQFLIGKKIYFAFLILLVSSAFTNNFSYSAVETPFKKYSPGSGKIAPTVPFFDASGRAYKLEEFQGNITVINFWATWCLPCTAEMSSFDRLAQKVKEKAIKILPISTDMQGAKAVEVFYQSHQISALPIFIDQGSKLSQAFGIRGIPTTIILNSKGQEISRIEGEEPWDSSSIINWLLTYLPT